MTPPTRQLGYNGPQVTAVGLGMMSLAGAYGQQNTPEDKFALLDHAHAIGERFWDTADVYMGNEEVLGEWFKRNPEKRKDIFLATKFALSYDFSTMEQFVDSSPDYVKKACEESLRKLGVDTIDLLYCHRVDGKTPIEKTVQAMVDLKK
jgi:aryl-alcohol dehydrogenase-like predicted oxidoreductase